MKLIRYQIVNKSQTPSDFIISSFHHNQLKEFHSLMPEIPIGILYEGNPAGYQKLATDLGATSINLSIKHINKKLVQEIHQNGLQVWIYTVNSEEDFEKMKVMGVEAVFTNFPERFIS